MKMKDEKKRQKKDYSRLQDLWLKSQRQCVQLADKVLKMNNKKKRKTENN